MLLAKIFKMSNQPLPKAVVQRFLLWIVVVGFHLSSDCTSEHHLRIKHSLKPEINEPSHAL